MDQKTRTNSFTTFQTPTAVTCQIFTSLTTSAIVTPSSSNFIQLTSSNLRPITNYTLVAGSQVPITHQYVVQSTARAIGPQYVNTGNVRHILSSSSQPTNVSYVLPSGAHIVRMNNVTTNTIASESQQNTQFVLTSSAHKANPSIISPLGPQSLKNPISTAVDNNLPRTIGITTSTTPILQRSGINIPKLNSAYYSQVKGNEAPKIALRPKLKEQKAGTSFILATNSTNRTKSVPISSLQKINTNFMQIPFIQKSGTVLSTNTIRSNVDNQHQKSQHQSVRSVILPSNFRNATVTSQQGTDCKLVLNSVNIPTQVSQI
uniref:Uncharacterized protein n=1 Tax=Sipha flava TaxID=143950 RepID=A0A2S2Q3N0_9HEMI